jgi:hypothetical protein
MTQRIKLVDEHRRATNSFAVKNIFTFPAAIPRIGKCNFLDSRD